MANTARIVDGGIPPMESRDNGFHFQVIPTGWAVAMKGEIAMSFEGTEKEQRDLAERMLALLRRVYENGVEDEREVQNTKHNRELKTR